MRSARFSRREQARFCSVAQAAKACGDFGKSQIDVPFDILDEDASGADFADDARNLRPKVTRIGFPFTLSSMREGLAGIAGREDMNAVAPRAAVEGSQIVPYRCRSQGRVCHPRHESGRRVGFPLDVTNSSISGLGELEAEIETGISGAEGKAAQLVCAASIEGTKSHKIGLQRPLSWRSRRASRASMC